MLIIIPGVATLYLSDAIPSPRWYVLSLLLFLLYVQQRDFRIDRARNSQAALPALFAELLLLTLGCYSFEGLLPYAYLSAVITLYRRPSALMPLIILIGFLMNAMALPFWSWHSLLALNLAYAAIAVLLCQLHGAQRSKLKLEERYDALNQKHHNLAETRRTVMDYAKKVEQYAQVEERNRIAHDLHDDLGHRLTRLKMMLEAATRLPKEQQARAYELVSEVRDQLGDSMESLRATVRKLKPAAIESNRYSLEGLLHQSASENGVKVDFMIAGTPYELYPSHEIILYRNAQEAITNAIRHGEATEVAIKLTYADSHVVMSVRNNGKLPDSGELRKGLGLQGMEERLRVVGGQLSIVTQPVFDLVTTLPRAGGQENRKPYGEE